MISDTRPYHFSAMNTEKLGMDSFILNFTGTNREFLPAELEGGCRGKEQGVGNPETKYND